jgi:hypothetical protein
MSELGEDWPAPSIGEVTDATSPSAAPVPDSPGGGCAGLPEGHAVRPYRQVPLPGLEQLVRQAVDLGPT